MVLREVFQNIQENYVSPTILSDWARETYGTQIEYIAFKSKFLYSIATQAIVSMGFGLSAVHPDQWLIERSTGAIYIQVRTLIITPKQSNAECKTLEFRDKKWIIIERVNHLSD